jgi:glycosyltransferase involved in cell wall biosynthesis
VKQNGLDRNIFFTGYVSNVADYLKACDYFLFPSESEGMPNALLEAASCGLAVVATRIGGNTDILDQDNLGYLVAVNDKKSLLNGILSLLQDPAGTNEMRRHLRDRIEKLFSIDVMLQGYIEVLTFTENKPA